MTASRLGSHGQLVRPTGFQTIKTSHAVSPSILPCRSLLDPPLLDALYVDDPAASAAAAAFAVSRFWGSPCLPFCAGRKGCLVSAVSQSSAVGFPGPALNSPPTLQCAGPSLLGARRPVSCHPSGCGARRGRQRRGSGCSCNARFRSSVSWGAPFRCRNEAVGNVVIGSIELT